MKRNRGPFALFKGLAPVILGRLAAAVEQVPYTDGLGQGQGFNTYLQTGRLHNAVGITTHDDREADPSANQAEVTYTAVKITDYKDLVQSLDVTAGATISKLGTEASVNARFFDREEFESSFLTYLVKVDVRRQPSAKLKYAFNWAAPQDARETYGNRFISDFVRGGALFARVSIITKDATKHQEVEQSASVAFTVFGADTKVTSSIKTSIESMKKHSEIRIYLHYVGAPPEYQATNGSDNSYDDELLQLKDAADRFLAEAQRHEWMRFAILERYANVPGFNGQFTPLDYSEATDRSWAFLNDFSKHLGIQNIIRKIAPSRYIGGRGQRDKLDDRSSDILAGYRSWVANVSAHPDKARQGPPYADPSVFRGQVLLAVQTTPYIAQRLRLADGGSTDFIDKKLHPGARKLFGVKAYDLDGVPGTTKLVFAKKWGEDKYICLAGRSAPPGYDVVSQLWVFKEPVRGVVNETIQVVAIPQLASIELRPSPEVPNAPDRRATRFLRRQALDLFRFYVMAG
ncbi:hypothetical protein HRG_000856 [Hirsutella rhossiliensis]|uniref:Uncharacterized protein n=1 Tax=Hirsutella rhossiliensis TaxID=111463 RepID=A0A9P8N7K0_9HYPO|nr:uncharacterized protein HRG_00856 [Hirsutella rhossiliensis]KAH0968214.1 hypothetical protein HRG_00856 [Hirsutella rhossiliensis]